MIYKTAFQILLFAISFYAGIWMFNHLNPWVGILLIIAIIIFSINKLFNYFKKRQL
jgi:hypothetical protein